MDLDKFLADEQAQGRTVSEDSAFTLNPAQMRAKVATFCGQERLYPFFRCLQGILRVAQSDLFLRYDSNGWIASFLWKQAPVGKHFQNFLLEGINEGFDHVGHTASQHFFFGLSAALGVDHYRLEWTSPQGGFLIHAGQFALTDNTHPEYCQLTFAMDAGWWERLTGGQRQQADTEQQLRARLCYSAVPVHISGERLLPRVPEPPDRPWASRLASGSNLAWRYLVAPGGQNSMRPPEVPLDRYRVGKKGKVWHLINDDPETPLPLSVQFAEIAGVATTQIRGYQPGGDELVCGSALFLSLEAGRQDWLFPVRDGLLTEPVPIAVAKGGVLVVAADDDLRYDLSGLRVINDKHLAEKLLLWQREAKILKSELRVSLANSTLRAESMPSQYYQASGYAFGGPFAGVVAGKVGPVFHRLLSRRKRPEGGP
jgi:hypothetical protein